MPQGFQNLPAFPFENVNQAVVASAHNSTRVICERYTFRKCFLSTSGLQRPYERARIHFVDVEPRSDVIDDAYLSSNIHRRISTAYIVQQGTYPRVQLTFVSQE
jgi:hypothetical protein